MAAVELSRDASERLREIVEIQERGIALRVDVDHSCHCGGLRYGIGLASAEEGDERRLVNGVAIFVAPAVVRAPGVASIDFVDSQLGQGFTITNSEHACGGVHAGAGR